MKHSFSFGRLLLWFVGGVAFCCSILVVLQQPWRGQGALHVVDGMAVSGTQVYIIQEHDGHGLNNTFVVAQDSDQLWKWFPIGYDDLLWMNVAFNTSNSGNVKISKYGRLIAEFDPKTFSVDARGRTESVYKQTADLNVGN